MDRTKKGESFLSPFFLNRKSKILLFSLSERIRSLAVETVEIGSLDKLKAQVVDLLQQIQDLRVTDCGLI